MNMNDTIQANVNNPVFASQYFNGTYDPTQGSVYRTGDILSNLLDDYTLIDNPPHLIIKCGG